MMNQTEETKLLEQIEEWNDADEFSRCIEAIEAIPEQERDYLLTVKLSRAYSNLAVLGDHGEHGTDSEVDGNLIQHAIRLLESVPNTPGQSRISPRSSVFSAKGMPSSPSSSVVLDSSPTSGSSMAKWAVASIIRMGQLHRSSRQSAFVSFQSRGRLMSSSARSSFSSRRSSEKSIRCRLRPTVTRV